MPVYYYVWHVEYFIRLHKIENATWFYTLDVAARDYDRRKHLFVAPNNQPDLMLRASQKICGGQADVNIDL